MTNEQGIDLNAIRKRAEHAQGNPLKDLDALFSANKVIRQDVPALIAEVERLRTQQTRLIAELEKADKVSDELRAGLFRQQLPGIRKLAEDYVDDCRIETMEDLKDFYAENRARKIEADREVYEEVCGMFKDMIEKRKETTNASENIPR
jgi:hypothetical protein